MDPLYWLIALAVFLAIEIVTLGLATIWFAAGAIFGLIAALLEAPPLLQFVLFFGVSILLLLTIRPSAVKKFNKSRSKTNLDALKEQTGRVLETIDNFNDTGTVQLDGKEWMARSANDTAVIEKGRKVAVLEIRGVKLIVEEK